MGVVCWVCLVMYVFLALIAVGSFIYVKIEDRKEQKNS